MTAETIFLSNDGYPSAFGTNANDIESAIIESVNKYGHNRNVTAIRYEDLKAKFSHFRDFRSKFVGAICSSLTIEDVSESDRGPYVWVERDGNAFVEHRIEGFLVLTTGTISSRNTFVAQSLFPFLFSQIKLASNTACKILSPKPIYLLCMVADDEEVPKSVHRDLDFVSAAGVRVLAPLRRAQVVRGRPMTIGEMEMEQSKLDLFSLDDLNRIFKVERRGLNNLLDSSGHIKGSNEKFGMLSLLTAALVARRSGFRLDVREFDGWLDDLKRNMSGSKVENMENTLNYLQKIAS